MRLCCVGSLLLSILSLISAAGCGGPASTSQAGSLQVVAPQSAMQAGASQQLKAILKDANGSTTDVTAKAAWSSQSNAVASVSVGGLVTAATSGSAKISASYQETSNSTQIQVTKLFGVSTCCPNQFLLLTPSMGQFSVVQSIGNELSGFFGSATDPENHRFYVPRQDSTTYVWSLLTLDTQMGVLISTQPLSITGGFDWQWDAVSQELLLITDWNATTNSNNLVFLDPASTTVTPILQVGDASVNFTPATSGFDSKSGTFYCIRYSSGNEPFLLAVSVSSGVIQSQLPITPPLPFVMQFDESSGLLYGLGGTSFVSIDPATGNSKVIGTVGDSNTLFEAFLSAIDSARRRFYVVEVVPTTGGPDTYQILGIDLDTGTVAETLSLNTPIILLGAEEAATTGQ